MNKIDNKQRLFFLILGVFGFTLTGSLLFNVQNIDHFQASRADIADYLQFIYNDDQAQKEFVFKDSYLPKTLIKLKSNNSKNKKTLKISCSSIDNLKYTDYSKKERKYIFEHTLLPHIVYENSQLLAQRFYLLNILKDSLDKIEIQDYKNYMLARKVKYFKTSRLFLSDIKTLKSLKHSSLVLKKTFNKKTLKPDFSIFPKVISKKEVAYINKVNLLKYNLTKNHALYIKRLAYKNWLRRPAYKNNTNLLLTALIVSVDVVPASLFLAQAKEESNMGQSRAAYTLNNLFGSQITPKKIFNSNYMGRVCKSKTVRLRKFINLQESIYFQLEVYNQNLSTMSLIKNNRLLERLNLNNLKAINIIDKMPGYAEKKDYKKRLTTALSHFSKYDQLTTMAEKLFLNDIKN